MIRSIIALYGIRFPRLITYMLQSTEYNVGAYLRWLWRTQNFATVMHRRTLDRTNRARLLEVCIGAGAFAQIVGGIILLCLWFTNQVLGSWQFGLAFLISYPVVWAHLIVMPLLLARWCIVKPRERRLIAESKVLFKNFAGIKIAVAGSYGKTSMKELLLTVLGEGMHVAATPANKNVAISHAQFVRSLTGNEEVLIIEYGEGAPGDVAKFADTTQPTHVVITGLAPAHLDHYKTLQAAAEDIFSAARAVPANRVYVNGESGPAVEYVKPEHNTYTVAGTLGWKVRNAKVGLEGTSFELVKGKKTIHVRSGLLGLHQVGPLSFAAALASELGMDEKSIEHALAKTMPFEHRMQPYRLGGAWIIDDTYNGNIEGIRAGTQLLADLPAKRKLYITPGLVDQGKETENIHIELGRYIAAAKPDLVVLMQNSVTRHIKAGLEVGGFKGELRIEPEPLAFYANLGHFVAAGDVVLMQNDWTDNYA